MKVPDESVSLPMVDRLKLTDAKGILSSLCESLTMPLMIFFCATPVLEVKSPVSNNNKAVYRLIPVMNL